MEYSLKSAQQGYDDVLLEDELVTRDAQYMVWKKKCENIIIA
jgi:hypothetical protein